MSVKNASSELTNNYLLTKLRNSGTFLSNIFQRLQPSRVFESHPDTSTAALGIMRPRPPITALVELDVQEKILESNTNPRIPVLLLTQGTNLVLAASLPWFHNSGRININAQRTTGLVFLVLIHSRKLKRLLTSATRLPFFTSKEKHEVLSLVNDPVITIDLLERQSGQWSLWEKRSTRSVNYETPDFAASNSSMMWIP